MLEVLLPADAALPPLAAALAVGTPLGKHLAAEAATAAAASAAASASAAAVAAGPAGGNMAGERRGTGRRARSAVGRAASPAAAMIAAEAALLSRPSSAPPSLPPKGVTGLEAALRKSASDAAEAAEAAALQASAAQEAAAPGGNALPPPKRLRTDDGCGPPQHVASQPDLKRLTVSGNSSAAASGSQPACSRLKPLTFCAPPRTAADRAAAAAAAAAVCRRRCTLHLHQQTQQGPPAAHSTSPLHAQLDSRQPSQVISRRVPLAPAASRRSSSIQLRQQLQISASRWRMAQPTPVCRAHCPCFCRSCCRTRSKLSYLCLRLLSALRHYPAQQRSALGTCCCSRSWQPG